MARAKKKNTINTAADDTVRALAAAATAVAKLRNDMPDLVLVDTVDRGGAYRGDSLVILDDILRTFAASGRVYAHNHDVIMTSPDNQSYHTLAIDGQAEHKAAARLSNLVMCVDYKNDPRTGELKELQFKMPDSVCDQLFASDGCLSRLPRVVTYAKHSIFDDDFVLHHPGYSEDKKILVQGIRLSPDMSALPVVPAGYRPRTVKEVLDVLPLHMRTLLQDFDWAAPVDLINAVGAILMGLLMSILIEDGHPMVLIRGNQPAIGKSLLAKALAMVFDGIKAAPIRKAGDEEFDKLLCGLLKKGRRTIFLDNVRGKMDSERLEAHVTSPTITLRILGTNNFGEWPNSMMFIMTSNDLRASADLVSRNLTIDLYTEGDPRKRNAERKKSRPLQYAQTHRAEILNEAVAHVLRWLDRGRPDGDQNMRFEKVSQLIGGILLANGLPGFASNSEDVAIEMDEGLQRMLELAEQMVSSSHANKVLVRGASAEDAGRIAADWVELFIHLHLIEPKPDEPPKSKAIRVAKLFSAYMDRTIQVDGASRRWAVTFRKREGRAGGKVFYYAEVENLDGDEPHPMEDSQSSPRVSDGGSDSQQLKVKAQLAGTRDSPAEAEPAGRPPASPTGWLRAAANLIDP